MCKFAICFFVFVFVTLFYFYFFIITLFILCNFYFFSVCVLLAIKKKKKKISQTYKQIKQTDAIFAFVHYRIFPIIRRTPIKSRVKFADFKINAGSVYKGPLVLSRSRRGRGHKNWLQLGISEASQAYVTSVLCKF